TRRRLKEEILVKCKEMVQEGKYPYGSEWLTLPAISALQKKLKWRDRFIFLELLLLFGFMLSLSYGFYRLMLFILPR
ncbi:MAG: hypothetical protein V3U15_01395, partial [Nitrospinota bacterium]